MARIHVDQVFLNDTKKDGSKYINKFGKEYKMCKVVSDGRYFTVWGTEQQKADIAVGDWLEGEMTESEFNGTTQYAFNLPKPLSPELEGINNRIKELENKVKDLEIRLDSFTGEEEEDLSSIPF